MGESMTGVRTVLTINDTRFDLHRDESMTSLKERVEIALRSGGKFVEFTTSGGQTVSTLVTASSAVLISIEVDVEPAPVQETVLDAPGYGLHLMDAF